MKRRDLTIFVLVATLIVSLFLGAGYAIRHSRNAEENAQIEALAAQCRAGNDARDAIRDVFRFIEQAIAEAPRDPGEPPSTKAERQQTVEFFAGIYERLKPRDCPDG